MTGRTHLMLGVIAAQLAVDAGYVASTPLVWTATIFGAIAPDFDSPDATVLRPSSLVRAYLPRWLRTLIDLPFQIIGGIVRLFTRHRGITHWPIVPIGLLLLGLALRMPLLALFCLGYLTHIAADACTLGGAPLLAPFRSRCFSLTRCRSGGTVDILLFSICIVLFVWRRVAGDWPLAFFL